LGGQQQERKKERMMGDENDRCRLYTFMEIA
jgi:hypothetical protein